MLNTVIDLLEGFADHTEEIALRWMQQEGSSTKSYEQLHNDIEALARGLVKHGLQKGDTVALCAPGGQAWVVACLGVLRAGGVVVPIDMQMDQRGLEHVIPNCDAAIWMTTHSIYDGQLRINPAWSNAEFFFLDDFEGERSWQNLIRLSEKQQLPTIEADDLAFLFYTSGTTGSPKGVPLPHAKLSFSVNALIRAKIVQEGDRVLLPLPMHHVYPVLAGILYPLAQGCEVIFPLELTGPQLVRAIQEGNVTAFVGVPRLYSAMMQGIYSKAKARGTLGYTLFRLLAGTSIFLRKRLGVRVGKTLLKPIHRNLNPGLRIMASAGSKLDAQLAWKLEGFGWEVGIGYGLTETAPLLTFTSPGEGHLDSVGKPLPKVELRLDTNLSISEESRQAAGDRPCGEVQARGPNIFNGYHKRPELTKDLFTEDGWFRTGDLGFFDKAGYLHILGRINTMIVTSGGENIQPEDVETVYQEHPVISDIAVFQKDEQLAALIVPDTQVIHDRGDGDFDWHIRIALAAQASKLASYKRVSSFAITLDPIPRTRLGKIRRHLLAEAFTQAQSGSELKGKPARVEDMSPTDQQLLENPQLREVWNWLCERYPDRGLHLDTNPQFQLGIDSLDWLNVTSEVRQRAGVHLSQQAYGRIDTVRDLLHEIERAAEVEAEDEELPFEDPVAHLSPLQKKRLQPLHFFMRLLADGYYYLNRFIMRRAFSLQAEGVENVPKKGPFVLAPNHVSHIDPLTVTASLDIKLCRQVRWAGWTGAIFHNPLSRFLSYLGRTVPIDPQASALSSLAVGSAVISEGYVLGWFPEGSRSPEGRLQELKIGLAMLLEQYDVPVVPIYIDGSFEVMPTSRFKPKRHPITVRFGKPRTPNELEELGSGSSRKERITTGLRADLRRLGGEREA